jgi:hypothetical protein
VGEELRTRNNGDLIVDNPELELEGEQRAAADRKHEKVHRRDD